MDIYIIHLNKLARFGLADMGFFHTMRNLVEVNRFYIASGSSLH